MPAICIHSVTTETFPILHSPRDHLDAIHLDDYYDTYLLMRAYLAYLDQVLDSPEDSQETAPAVVKCPPAAVNSANIPRATVSSSAFTASVTISTRLPVLSNPNAANRTQISVTTP